MFESHPSLHIISEGGLASNSKKLNAVVYTKMDTLPIYKSIMFDYKSSSDVKVEASFDDASFVTIQLGTVFCPTTPDTQFHLVMRFTIPPTGALYVTGYAYY